MATERAKSKGAIAGLILAAGESSRMGRDKALLAYHGSTFLETVIGTLREAGIVCVIVVLGHHAAEIARAVDLSEVEIIVNPEYKNGQTSSLQAGLRALERPDLEGVVLCLVDHPAVYPETIRTLVADFASSRAPAVIPTYRGKRGHPVVISRALFEGILELQPEKGANSVIRDYRDETLFVEVEDSGILKDIDDGEAYRAL